ncbi:MAG: DUF1259 domain-containing protein [Rubrobacter sp.]|nr:DUF1259 domain-containing protein [Rubrobacter sp.]
MNRRTLLLMGLVSGLLIIALVGLGVWSGLKPQSSSVDWTAVGDALGKDLESKGNGVYEATFPRSDLQVTSQNVKLDPSLDLGTEIYFQEVDNGMAMMMGEVVLTEDEVDPVITQLEQGGIEMTALHKHMRDESPRIWWLHVHSHADPTQAAKALRSALDKTGTPLRESAEESASKNLGFDTHQLDQIMGYQGQTEGGVYKYIIPYGGTIVDTSTAATIPPEMEAAGSSALFFQPTSGGKAATNGELLMTADEINPVAQALRDNDIQVVSVHNHLIDEEPRLFFMHFWGNDDAQKLGQGLRAALDQMSVGKSSAGG